MKRVIFVGPVLTASGYGEHARQLLRALVRSGKFEVSVKNITWGQTPFIIDETDEMKEIRDLVNTSEFEGEFDLSVQVTIPNEFQRLARVNVGVTAGIEVDRVSPAWIEKANENVDFLIVPSKHSAETFAGVSYGDDKGHVLKLSRPIVVCPEGIDTSCFNKLESPDIDLGLEPEFNFLSVGLGMDKMPGEDRKNISMMIKWFLEEFSGDKRVGLVLKVSIVNNSVMDLETVSARVKMIRESVGCGEYPKIKLVHGRLSKKQLASVYKNSKIKAYLTTTHGEGFGLPILEAAACGLPVLATNWSGHLDFLSTKEGKKFIPLDFEMTPIPKSAVWQGVMEEGSNWASVKESDFKTKIRKIFLSYEKPKSWADELSKSVTEFFDEKKIGEKFVELVSQISSQADSTPAHAGDKKNVRESVMKQVGLTDEKTLLFTMPMSAGDVFISTAVVDSLKKKFPEHKILFATQGKYTHILKDNPDIHKVIQFEQWMMDVPACESVFDEVYTPNLAIQTLQSNWVHGGKGRLLGDEMAAQCGVPFGEYKIKREEFPGLPEKYVVLHVGSGKGQWEARNYRHWNKVVKNLKRVLDPLSIKIVSIGSEDDMAFDGCVDLRGKTSYNQMAHVISEAELLLGIDSVSMHMAAASATPFVALFGSSHSTSTGPVIPKNIEFPFKLLEVERTGDVCKKACYKYQCSVDREYPCINHIDPRRVFGHALKILGQLAHKVPEGITWQEVRPKIAGYTHVFNPESAGFPYVESIKSMLGFCDEVIVVDGGSTDGSVEKIKAIGDEKVKIFTREWDWNEPGMDGMQKAYGRAMTSLGPDDFLWQQDADEIVHEDDFQKIRDIAERFPTSVDILHLPVIELWGDEKTVRTDRHSWKWRMSRNNFKITHGINKAARVFDDKTGRTYAKKGMSDGCEYVDIMTNEFLPHAGFYTKELEFLRTKNPEEYGKRMNEIFGKLPSVFHYSWANIPKKIENFKHFWNKCWANLYNEEKPEDRFPDVSLDKPETVAKKAEELKSRGGEHGQAKTFVLERTVPASMRGRF